jgi:mono/diheme cytochrome c family protein
MHRLMIPLTGVWLFAVAFAAVRAQEPATQRDPHGASASAKALAGPRRSSQIASEGGDDQAFVKQYCVTCHNERAKTGGLVLETLDPGGVARDAETWEKVVRKIKTGMMPPAGARRPDRGDLDAFANRVAARLDDAAAPDLALSTPALHRMNRAEYANAIRDLLALDIDVAPLLPGDGSSEGFDNLAEALTASPALIQGYVSAAMKISRIAVGDRAIAPAQSVYAAPPRLSQDRHIDGLPLGTRGGLRIRHTFPLDADYDFTVAGTGPGGGGPGALDVTIDGEPLALENPRRFRIPVKAGPHTMTVAVIDRERGAGVDEAYSDFRAPNGGFTTPGGVQSVSILGPFMPTGPGDTPSRRRIFTCRPTSAATERTCARTILTTLARRAYRGVATEADIATLLSFYDAARKAGDFEGGIQAALARVLVAPRFVFRIENEPGPSAPPGVHRISDVELASRLSFFLWSSIPDDELLDLAAKGRLRERETLGRQVRRMVADPKADAFIRNFSGQWLYLRDLARLQTEAAVFDDNLRQSFIRETEMLFGTIVRDDRSLLDLVDPDYTFLDERLARHYGIQNVRGSYFRRVALPPGSPRRGLLGQGSMLTVTSVATRTSPVSRGKWILENLLGTPPPVPPPGVENNLDDPEAAAKAPTLRKRLELHRANPTCAACHSIMDPMGFALENFDLIGAWRETEAGAPVDTTGRLADGTPLKGAADLREALLGRSDMIVTTATEKLLIYALGRPVHYYDMPTVRAIVRRAAANGNRFSSILLGIVESDAFQKRVKRG